MGPWLGSSDPTCLIAKKPKYKTAGGHITYRGGLPKGTAVFPEPEEKCKCAAFGPKDKAQKAIPSEQVTDNENIQCFRVTSQKESSDLYVTVWFCSNFEAAVGKEEEKVQS